MIGKKFERLTVVELAGKQNAHLLWKCACDCGNICFVRTCTLNSKRQKSCGCLKTELVKQRATKHNGFGTDEYSIWQGIMARTHYSSAKKFHRYAGRGISVCKEWLSFENFFKDMGKRPSKIHSIDRINKLNLENIDIYNLDFEEFINKYQNNQSIMFLDPPYYLKNKIILLARIKRSCTFAPANREASDLI